jgi:mevalonate pyrophosphate decarboxylase
MHSLFHTSQPAFSYWKPETVKVLRWILDSVEFGVAKPILTMDAGANVHLMTTSDHAPVWFEKLSHKFSRLKILRDTQGEGIRFHT